jgi:hypothetical protein
VGSRDVHVFLQLAFATTCNSSEFFNPNELEARGQQSVNHVEDICDQLGSAGATPAQFKNLKFHT